MKKVFFLFILSFLVACGDEGVTITVPASSSYSYNVLASTVNASNTFEFSAEREVDPGQIFTQAAEQIKSITLNRMVYSISGYENDPQEAETVSIVIQSRVGANTNDLAELTDISLENVQEALLFEEGNSASILTATQVASLEATIDNYDPFDLIVTLTFNKAVDSDFTVEVAWDITASVAQE